MRGAIRQQRHMSLNTLSLTYANGKQKMATFRCAVAVIILLMTASSGFAQDGEAAAQPNACSGDKFLVAFTTDAQYDAACAAFTACMEVVEDFDFVPCMPHFYAERAALCEASEDICLAEAQLHTALIGLTVGNPYFGHGQADEFWTDLAARIDGRTGLTAAEIEDTLAWYAPLPAIYNSEWEQHPMLALSSAVLQLLKGDAAAALELAQNAIQEDSNNPLLYLMRGDLYAAQGENERAALDYFMAATLTGNPELSDDLVSILNARTSAYPFSLGVTERYALYPTIKTSEGPGGRTIIDMTLEEPTEISLQQYGEQLLFIPADRTRERDENTYRVLLPLYPMDESVDESYRWFGSDYDSDLGSYITLKKIETGFKVVREDYKFEANSARQFLLVPEGTGDPRPQGFRCEGAPISRLVGATFATPLTSWDAINLYDKPGGEVTEIEQGPEMLIALDGDPECLGGFTLWPVTITVGENEYVGWIAENEDMTTYLYDWIEYD